MSGCRVSGPSYIHGGGDTFGKKNRYTPPDTPFAHSEDCKIVKADPNVELPWSRLEYGLWKRECACSYETWQEPAPSRVRLDPQIRRRHATWEPASTRTSPNPT